MTAQRSPRQPIDRFDLYERCVTNPVPTARFLRALHDGRPCVLGEDFSGTAALARAWIALDPRHRAVAVDRDPEPLARLRGIDRLRCLHADVLNASDRVDILACTNFPIGYWHTRADLLTYLRHARTRLKPRGLLVCDLYGGSDAFTTGRYTTTLQGPARQRITYTWEQRHADPLTGLVTNAIHFQVKGPGRAARAGRLRDAFVYHWRLWSIPELKDAMLEAGFASVDVHASLGDAIDHAGRVIVTQTTDPAELTDPWVVYLAARR